MSWWKSIIIGFCVYWVVFIGGMVLFVGLGLGYHFSNQANTFSEIMAFPTGTGKYYNFFLSALFWIIAFSLVIKIAAAFKGVIHFKK